jgi:hypothetical protein
VKDVAQANQVDIKVRSSWPPSTRPAPPHTAPGTATAPLLHLPTPPTSSCHPFQKPPVAASQLPGSRSWAPSSATGAHQCIIADRYWAAPCRGLGSLTEGRGHQCLEASVQPQAACNQSRTLLSPLWTALGTTCPAHNHAACTAHQAGLRAGGAPRSQPNQTPQPPHHHPAHSTKQLAAD